MRWSAPSTGSDDQQYLDTDTLVFKLNAECTRNKEARKDEEDPLRMYHNAHIYAKDIEWVPQGRQQSWAGPNGTAVAVNPDVLVAKMRPGQAIELEAHAIKGVGSDHAKFSPVATASYRLLPTIDITKPILGVDAKKFARCFPKGVVAVEEVSEEEASRVGSGYEGQAGQKKAVVKNTFKDTVSRECLRHDEFTGKVQLGRVRDHFIFSVESTGQYESDWLFAESVKILKKKCLAIKKDLANES